MADGSRKVEEGIQNLDHEIRVVRRGTAIAAENIKQHVGNLRPRYEESITWANQLREDQDFLLGKWENTSNALVSIGASQDLGICIHGARAISESKSFKTGTQITLSSLVDRRDVERAADASGVIAQRFARKIEDLNHTFEDIVAESGRVIEDFQRSADLADSDAGDQASKLMEEIEVLARKINADYEHILGLPETQKSLSQASKTAHLHKANFLPSLAEANEEVNDLLTRTIERKNKTLKSSVQHLQNISAVESKVSSVHRKLANLDTDNGDGQDFDLLNFVIRLPAIYGQLLVECVRRQEWAEKMTTDSSSLVEEMATYKDEETRRRKRWTKDVGDVVDLVSLDDMALGIEVNVQAQKQRWPKTSRDDVTAYLGHLEQLGGLHPAIEEIEEAFKALNAPSKLQARRATAFKNGSVHEAAYGRTSLLLRGDDETILALRKEKASVEDKLKTAESRVRKLEELLHRQSQLTQPPRSPSSTCLPSGNVPTFERHATSPVPNFTSALSKARETGSRTSSVSSRKVSMAAGDSEEKGLAQQIVSLEAQLASEKAQSAQLEKATAAQTHTEDLLKSQVREAISTKEDLLGNLEAQQHEFDHERRLLEDENTKLKIRLEELEDDFDRAMESRENVDKYQALEQELEKVKREAADDVQKAHGQIEFLQKDRTTQREKANKLEREVREHTDERATLDAVADQINAQLRNREQAQVDQHRALRSALLHLDRDESASEDYGALVETVEAVAEKSALHLQNIKDALETVRADNAALDNRIKTQEDEIYDLRERLGSEERAIFTLREESSAQRANSAELQAQLDYERAQHNNLKEKFATGETDSAALRSQLKENELSVADLLAKIAELEVQDQMSQEQIVEKKIIIEVLRNDLENLKALRHTQSTRAAETSSRLHIQNKILERLLEQIGLSVIRQDEAMVVQKAQRSTSASTTLNDPSMSMRRSLSGPMPSSVDPSASIDPALVNWADSMDSENMERRFGEFMKEIMSFDMDVFTEAVYKRVKEIEHIARKWQKETRAYRDKSHRFQSEAHERIALRNFKEGDLALFLPTRDQATKPWAAFNVGAPHCFLREQDSHNLAKRDWLIARISKVEERVVDLSKSMNGLKGSGIDRHSGDNSDAGAFPNNENPYQLSDGLCWYLIDAAEERPGAPISIGSGKVTVAAANVDAKGSIRMKKSADGNEATKTLHRSLDSRRSSTTSISKKGLAPVTSSATATSTGLDGMIEQSIDNAAAEAASFNLQANKDTHTEPPKGERPQSSGTLDVPARRSPSEHEGVGIPSAPDW